jgi:MYND finger
MDNTGRCGISECSQQAHKVCSGCKTVYYCSVACQRAAWPEHKQSCRSLQGRVSATANGSAPLSTSPVTGLDVTMHCLRLDFERTQAALDTEEGRAGLVEQTRQRLSLMGMEPAAIEAQIERLKAELATPQGRDQFLQDMRQQLQQMEQQLGLRGIDGAPREEPVQTSPAPRDTNGDAPENDAVVPEPSSDPNPGMTVGSYRRGPSKTSANASSGFLTRGRVALVVGLALAALAITYRQPLGQWLARARQIGA